MDGTTDDHDRREGLTNETLRSCDHARDCDATGRFLLQTYDARRTARRNRLQPRWKDMHYHSALDSDPFSHFVDWGDEDRGDVTGIARDQHRMGISYIQLDPRYLHFRRALLEQAIAHLVGNFRPVAARTSTSMMRTRSLSPLAFRWDSRSRKSIPGSRFQHRSWTKPAAFPRDFVF